MKFHPVAELFPMMDAQALVELSADISQNGLRESIWTHDGKIIDGRNRFLACKQASIEPKFREWTGKSGLVSFVWSLNGARRHLLPGQKAAIAVEMLPLLEKEAADRQIARRTVPGQKVGTKVSQQFAPPYGKDGKAAAAAAKIVGTNRQYVADAK